MEREILGRGSNTNYNYPNNLLKGFAAAKSMFPLFAQVQPCLVRAALQLTPMQGQSWHPRQAAQQVQVFFLTCPFLSFLGSKSGSEALSCKQIKLISHAKSSAKLRPRIFYSEYLFES